MNTKLSSTSNGLSQIMTDSLIDYLKLGLILTFRYGFYRWGVWIPAIADDAIHPSFIRAQKCILAGWNNWSGYYLLANDPETDIFLQRFYIKHCQS